jgi:hypothetical protein
MIAVNRMRVGRYEFAIEAASFRYISQSWSGPGWDFNFSGRCTNDDPEMPMFLHGGIGLFTEAAPLPLARAADYTGVVLDLPGCYDKATGEPYFSVDVGESYEVSDVLLRFAERDGARYRIEMSGTISASVLGHPERFEVSAWADEHADHAYPV